jgi:hypothetical protein
MKALDTRILRLENRVSLGGLAYLLVLCEAGSEDVLNMDRRIQILGEGGFLPTGPGIGVVNLLDIPDNLRPKEVEAFLRENGARTCGLEALIAR